MTKKLLKRRIVELENKVSSLTYSNDRNWEKLKYFISKDNENNIIISHLHNRIEKMVLEKYEESEED